MTKSRRDVRILFLHEFRLGHLASEATRNICHTMGQGIATLRSVQRWFQRFKHGDFDIEDSTIPGRPITFDNDEILQLIEADPRLTTRCLAERLGSHHSTIAQHLHALGKSWKYGVWIPHELTPNQLNSRVDACLELSTSHRTTDWLTNLVTGDEKWVLYVNHSCKRQWLGSREKGIPTANDELHPKKVMLCVWWGVRGVIHWEFLPSGKTITADVYTQQLNRVASKLHGKQDRVFFLHDNARPHIAIKTKKKIAALKWTVLPHPPYSPDLAPSDYYLFRSLAHALEDKRFDDQDHLKSFIDDFFSNKSEDFYRKGILSLPERWQQVIDTDGQYIS